MCVCVCQVITKLPCVCQSVILSFAITVSPEQVDNSLNNRIALPEISIYPGITAKFTYFIHLLCLHVQYFFIPIKIILIKYSTFTVLME